MRNWIIGIFLFLGWSAGSTYWYVCKIKGLCLESSSTAFEVAANSGASENHKPSGDSIPSQKEQLPVEEKQVATEAKGKAVEKLSKTETPSPISKEKSIRSFTLLFAFAAPETGSRAALDAYLDGIAAELKRNPNRKAVLRGYTDDTAARENNIKLSQRRCDAVAAMLVARGITSSQILSEPLGEADPVATNDTPEGRRLNRRVVISIQD